MTDRRRELAEGVAVVRDRVARACDAAGRSPQEVSLVTVTKFFPAEDAALLAEIGCTDLGESREQEASPKAARCAELLAGTAPATVAPRWHMLGRIQRNKARAVARWAHSAHSVDSDRLITALDNAAGRARDEGERDDALQVLLQVSLDDDPDRGGAPRAQIAALADRVAETASLQLRGVMGVPPLGWEPARAFTELAEVHAALRADHPGATELSAGMSADLETAVAHGSTCVRVGTAILGSRPITFR